jgi:hypothetical protein
MSLLILIGRRNQHSANNGIELLSKHHHTYERMDVKYEPVSNNLVAPRKSERNDAASAVIMGRSRLNS